VGASSSVLRLLLLLHHHPVPDIAAVVQPVLLLVAVKKNKNPINFGIHQTNFNILILCLRHILGQATRRVAFGHFQALQDLQEIVGAALHHHRHRLHQDCLVVVVAVAVGE
jgi:hypothetical protein